MELSQRLSGLRESFIREMTRLAITHKAINLSQGFPDFDPPRAVSEAAHRALDSGGNQYTITWGIPPLRQAIAGAPMGILNTSPVRFAFAKKLETLNAAGERLAQRKVR